MIIVRMFYDRLPNCVPDGEHFHLTVHDMIECIHYSQTKERQSGWARRNTNGGYYLWWPQVICQSVFVI